MHLGRGIHESKSIEVRQGRHLYKEIILRWGAGGGGGGEIVVGTEIRKLKCFKCQENTVCNCGEGFWAEESKSELQKNCLGAGHFQFSNTLTSFL